MRDVLVGIFLGIWIIKFTDWLGRYGMSDDMAFYLMTGLIAMLLLWRFFLDIIHYANPRLWLKINKRMHKVADREFWERLAEQEARQKKLQDTK